jgi:hypothetical protein
MLGAHVERADHLLAELSVAEIDVAGRRLGQGERLAGGHPGHGVPVGDLDRCQQDLRS